MAKKKPIAKRNFQNEVISLRTQQSSAVTRKPVVDPNLPRTKRAATALLFKGTGFINQLIFLRNPNKPWKGLKSNPAIPQSKYLSDEYRTAMLYRILQYGACPSLTVANDLGRNARSIGQQRRYNLAGWENISNQHLKRANNHDRVKFRR